MSSDRDARLGYQLKLAQQGLQKAMEDGLRPLGLTLSQFSVLRQIDEKPGQTNADLARRAFITPQSMQGVLTNLERSGLISRSPDAEHGRRQPAELTASGRRALARADIAVQDVEAKLAQAIKPLSTADVFALFQRIQHHFSSQ